MSDKIYIIGAGAVGKALAVSLKMNENDVTLIRGSVDDNTSYFEEIKILYNNEKTLEESIEISTLGNYSELNGIIVLTNKSYGNELLSDKLTEKVKDSPIVLLQNGLGIEEPFINNNFPEIYRCVLFLTSQIVNESEISYRPVAVSPIGTIKRKNTDLNGIVAQLNSPNFQFKAENNIQKVIWEKAIANSVFNSICPLLDVDNGIFQRDAKVFNLAKRIITECISIASENSIYLDQNELEERVLFISKMSDGQLISTLQDIRNGRRTEIETLNLEIANKAKKANKEHLVMETRLLGELTKLKSELVR